MSHFSRTSEFQNVLYKRKSESAVLPLEWALSGPERRASLHSDCVSVPLWSKGFCTVMSPDRVRVVSGLTFRGSTDSYARLLCNGGKPSLEPCLNRTSIRQREVLEWALSIPARRASFHPDCAFVPPWSIFFLHNCTCRSYILVLRRTASSTV